VRIGLVPAASLGAAAPFAGLACELGERGHEVHLASPPASLQYAFHMSDWTNPAAIRDQSIVVQDLLARVGGCDLLVADQFMLGAMLAARASGTRLVVFASAFPMSPSSAGPRWYEVLEKVYHQAARWLGAPPIGRQPGFPLLGELCLVRAVPALLGSMELPQQARLAGACLWGSLPSQPDIQRWLEKAAADHRPLVHMQIGNLNGNRDFIEDLFDAAAQLGARVAANLGRHTRAHARQGPDFLVKPTFDHLEVLTHASVSVSLGNASPVLSALVSAVPTMIVEYGGGAEVMGHCCAQAGTGISLTAREVSYRRLHTTLGRLLSEDSFCTSAARLQRDFSAIDSFSTAAQLIENLSFQKKAS
jgi:UDP:flavonoid glycosyltransferase YjiC (YdhE family)